MDLRRVLLGNIWRRGCIWIWEVGLENREIGGILLWVCGGSWKLVGRKGRVFVNGYRVGFGFGFYDLGLWGLCACG